MSEPTRKEVLVFNAALELTSPAQREAYLAQACTGDEPLRRRVEALLRAHAEAEGFFDTVPAGERPSRPGAAAGPAARAGAAPVQKAGDRIGRYKLLQQIGEGGCGVVYMAEQEEPVRRRVALKVIKLGMDTGSVIARFEAERQALALMDHPNIAKVLDAGATETGRPYFVMELVRGIKLTDYCDEKRLPIRERLDLFMQVCGAIQHAHQKGIIHRDIKPSNILVTVNDGVPVPKVIDFGIAKATSGQQLTDKTVFTAFEQFIGTPAYMSPEQAVISSLDVDTRSDIYALGVLLYELLSGKTPFDAQELLAIGLDEMRRTIRETEPARPSTRLNAMPGKDLSTVAQRRGLDAPKLVTELRGDLDWVVMKCLEKDRSRRYETASGLARDIQRHLKDEPVSARPPSLFYRLHKLARRNRRTVLAVGAVTAALLLGFGISMWLHRNDPEFSAREAVTLAKKRLGNDNPELPAIMLRLVDVLKERDKISEAREWAEQAVALYRSHPDWSAAGRITALDALNESLKPLSQFEEAISVQKERLQLLRAQNDEGRVKDALGELAWSLLFANRYVEAETVAREFLATPERTATDEAQKSWVQGMLGESLMRQRRYTEAEPFLLSAYEGVKKHEAEIGADWRGLFLGETIARVADFYKVTHQPQRAAEWKEIQNDFEKAEKAKKSGIPEPDTSLTGIETTRREELANARKRLGNDHLELPDHMYNLIDVLMANRKRDEACLLAEEELGLVRRHPEWPALEREDALAKLDGILFEYSCFGASAPVQAERLTILRKRVSADDPVLRDALLWHAWTLYAIHQSARGEVAARECLGIFEKKYPNHHRIGFVQSILGGCLFKQKRYKEAEPLLLAGAEGVIANQNRADSYELGGQFLWEPLARLAWFYEETGRPEEAARWIKELDEIQKAKAAKAAAEP
ncbi:MAG TPA: serine/threonine-protein kinase [Verrucomicrobiae bacterium]|nr:serine/threonine-protein kinase [Verrucomicrobiae bacterium]